MTYPLGLAFIVLLAAATMLGLTRLGFGQWLWHIQGWALLALVPMVLVTEVIRRYGKRFDPEVGSTIMLGGNLGRMAVVLSAMLLGERFLGNDFPAFCASTMVVYLYYLVAEIYGLVRESQSD